MKLLAFAIAMLCCSAHAVVRQRVVICGVCRDVEHRLPRTMQIMEQIGALFEDYRIIVYENNSQDATPHLLAEWARQNPKVLAKSEFLSEAELDSVVVNRKDDQQPYRPELIARARNIVMNIAMSAAYAEFAHIIWMDMDFVIPPDFDGIVEAFTTTRDWDGVLAYGVDPDNIHWDWYAFRDAHLPLGSELLGNKWWYLPKTFALKGSDDWYPVYSAFGGCGIYKKSSVGTCRYSAVVNEDLEHTANAIISDGITSKHPQVLDYLSMNEKISARHILSHAQPKLDRIEDPSVGVVVSDGPNPLTWRMSSFVYQYPSTCEHVTFHACMMRHGHTNLFINPRLVFHYGG